MKATHYLGLPIVFLALISCSDSNSLILHLPEMENENVYNCNGPTTIKTEEGKPKVLTSIVGLNQFEHVYSYTPRNKINTIIAENPEFDFLFYFVIEKKDSLVLFQKLKQYNIDYPVFIDYEDRFRKVNPGLLKNNTVGYTMICDRENRFVKGCMIGTTQSFFDEYFELAKTIIK